MASDKTEKATPQRLKKAREEGQFLSAKEMVGALQFVAVLVILSHMVPAWQDELRLSMTKLLERSTTSRDDVDRVGLPDSFSVPAHADSPAARRGDSLGLDRGRALRDDAGRIQREEIHAQFQPLQSDGQA